MKRTTSTAAAAAVITIAAFSYTNVDAFLPPIASGLLRSSSVARRAPISSTTSPPRMMVTEAQRSSVTNAPGAVDGTSTRHPPGDVKLDISVLDRSGSSSSF